MKLYNFTIRNYKKIIFLLVILNIFIYIFFPLKPKALSFGENYSEFATNKVQLARFYGTYGDIPLYGANNNKTACNYNEYNLNCWYNAKLSLVKYEPLNISDNRWTTLRFYLENNLYANTSYVGSFKAITNNTTAFIQNFSGQGVNGVRNISKVSCSGSTCEVTFTFTNTTATNQLDFQNTLDIAWSFQGLDNIIQQLYFVQIKENTSNQDVVDALDKVEDKIDETNDKLNDIEGAITDTTPPSEDELNVLNGASGWLPPGPIDSILTLPLTMMESISNNLGKECSPLEFTLPYINSKLYLPCFNSFIYNTNFDTLWNWFGTISGAFLLYYYLLSLYKWVDNTLQFRENNHIDNWGGV